MYALWSCIASRTDFQTCDRSSGWIRRRKSSTCPKYVLAGIPNIVSRSPNQESLPLLMSQSHPTDLPASRARRSQSFAIVRSLSGRTGAIRFDIGEGIVMFHLHFHGRVNGPSIVATRRVMEE